MAHDVLDLDDGVVDQDAGDDGDASRLTRLSEKPAASSAQKAGMMERGRAMAAMIVARQSRRKMNTTMMARMAPSIIVFIVE